MMQKILSAPSLKILHHLQKLRKEKKDQVLKLIIQSRPSLDTSLPGLGQSTQLCCRSLRNHHAQSMAQTDDVRNDLRILPIRLPRRIALQLFHSLRMHGIDLDQLHRLLPQIMHQRFSISSCGFKTHDHFLQVMSNLHPANTIPQFLKPLQIIGKFKGLTISPVGTSTVSDGGRFANIDGNNQRFGIDYSVSFFVSILFTGYTPFPGLRPACELGESARKSIAFLLGLTTFYNIASSVVNAIIFVHSLIILLLPHGGCRRDEAA